MSATHPPPSSPPPSFPCFPLLPLELRLKIWHHTLIPRHLLWDSADAWPSPPLSASNAAIHANHEARTAILSSYTLVESDSATGVWINFDLDTVCMVLAFDRLERLLMARSKVLERVRLLELERVEKERFLRLRIVRKGRVGLDAVQGNVKDRVGEEGNLMKDFLGGFDAVTDEGRCDVMLWIRKHWWKA